MDQSLLTGESKPVTVASGDRVHAGTVNMGARLRVRVDVVGNDTRVGKLMQLVEECSRRRAPIVQMADRLAGWFVVVVLLLAGVTLGIWLWLDSSRAVDNAVALLIVCCPCALGLSTPLAIAVAIGRAAKRRILVKGGETLELLARPGAVVLDKTGTITAGRATVVHFTGDEGVKRLVAALEQHSSHPIALALVEAFTDLTDPSEQLPTASQVRHTAGRGLTGRVDGRQVAVGSPAYLQSQGAERSLAMQDALQQVLQRALLPSSLPWISRRRP